MQLTLVFSNSPEAYQDDRSKVVYALSFLRGTTMNWFEPGLLDIDNFEPEWYNNYSTFLQELRINFGPHDATGDAEAALAKLKMKDTARITQYIVEFNSIASQLDWNDGALRHHFYSGLPDRIKDDVSRFGKPPTLVGMRFAAQQADARYWERRTEIQRDQGSKHPNKSSSDNKQATSSNSTSTSSGPLSKKKKKGKTENSSNNAATSSSTSGTPSSSSKPSEDLSKVLDKNGKLTATEKQRRKENNLCLWCAKPGHMANACPLNSQARAAKADTTSEPQVKPAEAKKA